jgi:hypothetical protein
MLRLPTITHEGLLHMTFKKGMRPVHPDEALRGEVLREEYLKLLGLSANALAKALRLSASRIGASFWSAGVSLPIPPCGSRDMRSSNGRAFCGNEARAAGN